MYLITTLEVRESTTSTSSIYPKSTSNSHTASSESASHGFSSPEVIRGASYAKRDATTTTSSSSSSSSQSSSSLTNELGTLVSKASSGSSNNSTVGLAIGIPVAVVGAIIILVSVFYFLKARRSKQECVDEKLNSQYDANFNYRHSLGINNEHPSRSPDMRAIYQVKANSNAFRIPYESNVNYSISQPSQSDFLSTPRITTNVNESELSLKELPGGTVSSKWNLNTPLSRWFATKANDMNLESEAQSSTGSLSTGHYNGGTNAPATPVPMTDLKKFKLKVRRSFMPRTPEAVYIPDSHVESPSLKSDDTASGSEMFKWDSKDHIKEQIISSDCGDVAVPALQPIHQIGKARVDGDKPLPQKPLSNRFSMKLNTAKSSLAGLEKMIKGNGSALNVNNERVYEVTHDYTRNLTDELSIHVGEYYKILAHHTDGWCLVEKVDLNGSPLVGSSDRYINDGRGVVPAVCLQVLK